MTEPTAVSDNDYFSAYAEQARRSFTTEGTMIALATCFPGASTMIPADESLITSLDISDTSHVYGGTSGRLSHLFVGMFHGLTGFVFDMGSIEGAVHCPAVCCGQEKLIACLNGPSGGRIVTTKLQTAPFDCIQEWFMHRDPIDDWGEPVPGQKLQHAVADAARETCVGLTANHLFCIDFESGNIEVVAEVNASGRLAVGPNGNIWGIESNGALFCLEPGSRKLTRNALNLPKGRWDAGDRCWGKDASDGKLYIADDDGVLFTFNGQAGFSDPLGRTPVTGVGAMAATFDGRLYGICGSGIGRMFRYHPQTQTIQDLGVAVSVINRRRYGYEFSQAVVGRDGQIFFGENDNLGHLWIYIPRIQRSS